MFIAWEFLLMQITNDLPVCFSLDAINRLKDAEKYDNFSYHTSMCKIFDNTCGEDPGMIGGGS